MANRREEKERLRQARIEAERQEASEQRRRLLLGYIVAGVLTAAVVVGIGIVILAGGEGGGGNAHIQLESGETNGVEPDQRTGMKPPEVVETDLVAAARAAGCELQEDLPSEGNTHLPDDTPTPDYDTNPPTSGPHVDAPLMQADGAYLEMPQPIDFVHALEHGRIEIQYSPQLPEKAQLELKGLYDTMFSGVLLFPNSEMPYEVAATAWENLIGCEKYIGAKTLNAIRAFAKKHFDQAPESVPVNPDDPTPLEPAQ